MAYWNGTSWVPNPVAAPAQQRRAGRLLGAATEASVIVLLVFGLLAGTAVAGGKGSDGANQIIVADGVFATAHDARVSGDRSDYWVAAECMQGTTVVYREWVRADADGHATLMLGPTELWSGGDGTCIATAGFYGKNSRWKSVGSTSFFVSGN